MAQSWLNASPLIEIAASQQSGGLGAQLCATDESYALWTCYQQVFGNERSGWLGPNQAGAPTFMEIAGTQQISGSVQF